MIVSRLPFIKIKFSNGIKKYFVYVCMYTYIHTYTKHFFMSLKNFITYMSQKNQFYCLQKQVYSIYFFLLVSSSYVNKEFFFKFKNFLSLRKKFFL